MFDMAEVSDCVSSEEEFADDFVSRLPVDLSILVMTYLHPQDLIRASRVSKIWRRLVNSNVIWKKVCVKHGLSDEIFPHELKANSAAEDEVWCRWAQIYRLALIRRKKWEFDDHINLCPSEIASCFGVHGTTIAVADRNGWLSVFSNVGQDIIFVEKIEVKAKVRDVVMALNSVVILVGDWAAVLVLSDKRFETEAVFHPEHEFRHDQLHDLVDIEDGCRLTKTLLVTKDVVWFKTSCLKIYHRVTRSFTTHKVTHITDVKHNQNWVALLRPGSIDIYTHSGWLECTVQDESFYTGLVVSSCGAAFLESPDFDDPVAAYLNFKTKEKTVLNAKNPNLFKVYKLALYQDTIFCLNGREKFSLSCHSPSDQIKWVVPLVGSKYLRPGKDFFKIICSKFIFLSPAQVRLDVFDLFDKDSGDKLYTVSIHTSSYNICEVSDVGLTIQSNSHEINAPTKNLITWRSMA